MHIHVNAQYDSPGCTVCETEITGTHLGPYLNQPPSGNPVKIELAAIYLFDEDGTKLIAERIYYDQAALFAQMQQKRAESA